jgi:hypothetical protein
VYIARISLMDILSFSSAPSLLRNYSKAACLYLSK